MHADLKAEPSVAHLRELMRRVAAEPEDTRYLFFTYLGWGDAEAAELRAAWRAGRAFCFKCRTSHFLAGHAPTDYERWLQAEARSGL